MTNSGADETVNNHSMVFIEWDAVMIDNPDTQNGSVYWVSAGAEYNQADEIWIGQAALKTILDDMVCG